MSRHSLCLHDGYICIVFMPESWLHIDIVYALIAVIFGHVLHVPFISGQCLYQDIDYARRVVISRHCSCIDSGYIKILLMYRQWLYQDIVYV